MWPCDYRYFRSRVAKKGSGIGSSSFFHFSVLPVLPDTDHPLSKNLRAYSRQVSLTEQYDWPMYVTWAILHAIPWWCEQPVWSENFLRKFDCWIIRRFIHNARVGKMFCLKEMEHMMEKVVLRRLIKKLDQQSCWNILEMRTKMSSIFDWTEILAKSWESLNSGWRYRNSDYSHWGSYYFSVPLSCKNFLDLWLQICPWFNGIFTKWLLPSLVWLW